MNVTQPGQLADEERRVGMSFKRITAPMEAQHNLEFSLQRRAHWSNNRTKPFLSPRAPIPSLSQ
jgi:hypothetical protein